MNLLQKLAATPELYDLGQEQLEYGMKDPEVLGNTMDYNKLSDDSKREYNNAVNNTIKLPARVVDNSPQYVARAVTGIPSLINAGYEMTTGSAPTWWSRNVDQGVNSIPSITSYFTGKDRTAMQGNSAPFFETTAGLLHDTVVAPVLINGAVQGAKQTVNGVRTAVGDLEHRIQNIKDVPGLRKYMLRKSQKNSPVTIDPNSPLAKEQIRLNRRLLQDQGAVVTRGNAAYGDINGVDDATDVLNRQGYHYTPAGNRHTQLRLNKSTPVNVRFTDDSPDILRYGPFERKAFRYSRDKNVVNVPATVVVNRHPTTSTLAHELGHVNTSSPNILYDELRASAWGQRKLKELGASPQLIRNAHDESLNAYRTYYWKSPKSFYPFRNFRVPGALQAPTPVSIPSSSSVYSNLYPALPVASGVHAVVQPR